LGFIKGWELLDSLNDYQLLKKNSSVELQFYVRKGRDKQRNSRMKEEIKKEADKEIGQ
jgi:hypothetical protein